MMTKKIRAKVALISDSEQIAVNAGSLEGVQVDDRIHVLKETPIPDPDNPDELLGIAFIRKGIMIIESVEEKFSTARVLRTRQGFMSPSEPTFKISTGNVHSSGHVHLNVGDPVDILIDTPDEVED
ncbi:hypothetical protein [Glutamicibacter sp. NPDC127525]|uniref:hypothetical protein n=1 Tax=unclassified Glutamicibacter TaxID=2627139 RepID=UPI00363A9165